MNKEAEVISIYQRGKSWYYDFQSRGERYAGCIGQVSKTVAKEVLARKRAEAAEGRYSTPAKKQSPLFEDMAAEYLQYYQANRRPKSFERHQMAFKALKPFFGGHRLTDINPFLIEKYKRHRKEQGRSEVTINRELVFLKNLFTMAITWGKASENPVSQVRFFREDNSRTRVVTDEEELRLLTCCNPYLRPLVITALHTGFRKSELLALRWEHVDFRHHLITVEAAYAKNGETRGIPMTATLTDTLRALKGEAAPSTSVFRTHEGTPYRHIAKVFNAACRRAGLTDVTFHDLRHTFASRLVMAGVDLPTVQAFMGHKTIAMTMRYTHLAPGHKRTAITVLDRMQDKVPSIFPTGRKNADRRAV